jgi:hypothetical protein
MKDVYGNTVTAVSDTTTWNFTSGTSGIAFVNSANVINSTSFDSDPFTYTSSNYTPASNGNVLVILVSHASAVGAPIVKWNGGSALTAAASELNTSAASDFTGLYTVTSPGTSAAAVTVELGTGDDASAMNVTIMEFSGVNTTTPVVGSQVNNTSTLTTSLSSYSIDLTSTTSGNAVVGCVAMGGDASTTAASDDATAAQINDTGSTGTSDTELAALYHLNSAGGTITLGVSTSGASTAAALAAELAAA